MKTSIIFIFWNFSDRETSNSHFFYFFENHQQPALSIEIWEIFKKKEKTILFFKTFSRIKNI